MLIRQLDYPGDLTDSRPPERLVDAGLSRDACLARTDFRHGRRGREVAQA